jgi:hypothetical protein
MVFRPVLESPRLPLTIPRAFHGSGVDGAQVGSWGGYLARSLLGSVGMDSLLECLVPGACGLLPLRPIVAGA